MAAHGLGAEDALAFGRSLLRVLALDRFEQVGDPLADLFRGEVLSARAAAALAAAARGDGLSSNYLQVLLPVLPLQLPEQQSLLLVQLAPDGLQEGPPFGSSHCATLG